MRHLRGALTAKLHIHEDDVLALKRVGAINKEQYNKLFFFSTAVPCILILSKSSIYQLMHNRVALKEY